MRVDSVLFEANDPIDETKAQALAVNEVLRDPLSDHLDEKQTKLRWCIGGAGLGIVLGVLSLLVNAGLLLASTFVVIGLLVGGGGYFYLDQLEPEVTVTGVEQDYWTGHCIPDDNGVIVYDATRSLDTTSFNLERLSDSDAVTTAHERLTELEEFPVVMPPGQNVEETFTGALENVQAEIETAEQRTVEAPLVAAESRAAEAVEFFADVADTGAEPIPLETTVAPEAAHEDVEALSELEQLADEDDDAKLEALSEKSRQLVGDLSGMQEVAFDLLNDHVGVAADAFGMVSYNFYCPDCQVDDIDSQVDLSDPQAGTWYCETCRSEHETEAVIPRHRLKDDVVNPVWDQLWIEKDDQRREIYENVEDQKEDLQEREFEQRREEIRTATDRIRDLRSRIRDLKTEAQAAEGKVEEIGDLMVKYERLHEERKAQFQQEVQESFAEIDEQTERILEETRNEEQERIEQAEKAAKEKAQLMREEEQRREVEKFVAAQQMENARTDARMRQQAALHDEEMDMEKRQHRENWMLKTRGRTSLSGHIDAMKLKKDRVLGQSVYESGGDE